MKSLTRLLIDLDSDLFGTELGMTLPRVAGSARPASMIGGFNVPNISLLCVAKVLGIPWYC